MSDHLFEPYDRLVTIIVRGKLFKLPENNLLLRQLSYVAPDIASGKYCWNGECRYCEITYQVEPGGPMMTGGLACLIKARAGLRVTKLAFELRYNLSEALAAAPSAED